jgi:cytochrome c1
MPPEKLRMWLLTPRKVNPATAMPDLNLSDQEAEAIIHYLRNLDDA